MQVQTDSPRVRLSRRMVLEFLSSSVDVSTAPELQQFMEQYEARRSGTVRRGRRPQPTSVILPFPAIMRTLTKTPLNQSSSP